MGLNKRLQNEKGFTLVEVMIAAVVVAIVVLGFMGAATAIQLQGEAAYQRSVAIQEANRVVELMRNAAVTGTFPANVTGTYSGTLSGYTALPSESISVSYANASANPLDATITVSYLENGRRTTTASLRTYITQRA